jgi:hypothetical protein
LPSNWQLSATVSSAGGGVKTVVMSNCARFTTTVAGAGSQCTVRGWLRGIRTGVTVGSGCRRTGADGHDYQVNVKLHANGTADTIEKTSLRGFLDSTEPFKTFRAQASKENGIDAEGLAVAGETLFVGFRGPVLRGNWVPVLRGRFAGEGAPLADPRVVFVNLGGLGIRDLVRVSGGFLILAGPVGDGAGGYPVFFWDGRDCTPGPGPRPEPEGTLQPLGTAAARRRRPGPSAQGRGPGGGERARPGQGLGRDRGLRRRQERRRHPLPHPPVAARIASARRRGQNRPS